MKTIFITCFRGIISRNILATDVLATLRYSGVRVVIIAPETRTKILNEEFGGDFVVVEGVPGASEKYIKNPVDRLMWALATNLLATKTRDVQRRVKFAEDGNTLDYFFSRLLGVLGRLKSVRNFFRFIWRRAAGYREFDHLFEKYHPDLIFATDVYALEDVKLMRCAGRRNIATVGMVRSWDNVTSKTLLTHIPDYMVVNSERIKSEIMHYGDVPEERIFASGVPHYSHYRPEKCMPREVFLKKYGIAPKEKLVLLAAPSDHYLDGNPITPVALRALGNVKAKILVRLPLVGKADIDQRTIEAAPKTGNAIFDDPGTYPDFIDAHLDRAADQHLADCLNASDVVITWASTMIIDAAVFNKPVILLGFDASPRPYGKSILRFYDYEHHHPALEHQAVRLVKSPAELVAAVKSCLADPRSGEEGRRYIVQEFCGPLDGEAGKRLGKFILDKLAS